jgi:hypothetical protein
MSSDVSPRAGLVATHADPVAAQPARPELAGTPLTSSLPGARACSSLTPAHVLALQRTARNARGNRWLAASEARRSGAGAPHGDIERQLAITAQRRAVLQRSQLECDAPALQTPLGSGTASARKGVAAAGIAVRARTVARGALGRALHTDLKDARSHGIAIPAGRASRPVRHAARGEARIQVGGAALASPPMRLLLVALLALL